jgi:hypothetical protein
MTDSEEATKRALAEKAMRRAAARRDADAQPLGRRLPANKSEYPKLLCLDQNKWIDLARAHYGRGGGAPFRAALDAVRGAIATGTLVVPVLGANLYEVAEPKDGGRRERLARFMVELSENHSLVNHQVVLHWELRRALLELFLRQSAVPPIRPALLRFGMFAAAMGKEPVITTGELATDALVEDAMYDPELAIAAIVQFMDREGIRDLRAKDEHATQIVEGIRRIDAHLGIEERRMLEMRTLLAEGSAARKLDEVIHDLVVDGDAFRAWLQEPGRLRAFTDAVPSIEVPTMLMLHRDANKNHRSHPNDAKDFSFLKLAIPYANIVVAEKSWTHFAVASGLADKYGTRLSTDTAALPDLLKEEGCATAP